MIVSLLFAAAAVHAALADDALVARASVLIQAKDDAVSADPVVGLHHGVTVLLTSRCSDICPTYTVRIVHYDLQPGAGCAAAGGVTVSVSVPISIASIRQDFCVPAILSQKQLYIGHPYQTPRTGR